MGWDIYMKITKGPDSISLFRASSGATYDTAEQMIANEGCDVCPFCEDGGMPRLVLHEYRGLIFTKKVDHYICMKCKAKWESEPYRY